MPKLPSKAAKERATRLAQARAMADLYEARGRDGDASAARWALALREEVATMESHRASHPNLWPTP